MSMNDHVINLETYTVVTGTLGSVEELDRALEIIRCAVSAEQSAYTAAVRDQRVQFQKEGERREVLLREQVGAWASMCVANSLADVVALLIEEKASSRLVTAVARLADESSVSSYVLPIVDPCDSAMNMPVSDTWLGARGEGEVLS